ncbi:hypothetical protein, partial [Cellulomonas sp.]|uniref:hypothetical protein n=1 Tax=Cellulomonas sp. TaxID=40001 RepID=UPI001B06C0F7
VVLVVAAVLAIVLPIALRPPAVAASALVTPERVVTAASEAAAATAERTAQAARWNAALADAQRITATAGLPFYAQQAAAFLAADRVKAGQAAAVDLLGFSSLVPDAERATGLAALAPVAGTSDPRWGFGAIGPLAYAHDAAGEALLLRYEADELERLVAGVDGVWAQFQAEVRDPAGVLGGVTRADQAQRDRITRAAAAIAALGSAYSAEAAPAWAEYIAAVNEARATEAAKVAEEQAAAAERQASSVGSRPFYNWVSPFQTACLAHGGAYVQIAPNTFDCAGGDPAGMWGDLFPDLFE